MTLNLENLPAAPVLRGRAPRLMTPRRRRVWVALLVVVVAAVAITAFLWRYQPLTEGPFGGEVEADTEVWFSSAARIALVEFEQGTDMAYGFSLVNQGLLPVTITELHPGAEADACSFVPTSVRGASGTDDVYDAGTQLQALPLTVAPGEQALIRVDGRLGDPALGACQLDGIRMALPTIPATVKTGWLSHDVELPISHTIGWGHDVEDHLTPSRG